MDPESGAGHFTEARGHDEWQENRSWTLSPAVAEVVTFVETFNEFPPRQKSLDFNMDEINMDEIMETVTHPRPAVRANPRPGTR